MIQKSRQLHNVLFTTHHKLPKIDLRQFQLLQGFKYIDIIYDQTFAKLSLHFGLLVAADYRKDRIFKNKTYFEFQNE